MEIICNLILSAGITIIGYFLFTPEIIHLFDRFFSILGTSFSGRSAGMQMIILIFAGIIISGLLSWVLKRISEVNDRLYNGILILIFLVILYCFASICFNQTIRRDDYWEIHDSQYYGFPGFLKYEFFQINGRYFDYFLKSMYAFFPPTAYINTMLYINILCLWVACAYLCRVLLSLCSDTPSFRLSAVTGMGLALGAIFVSPKLWEVWFWGGGTFIYGVGIVLATFILALYIDACRGNPHIILTLIMIICGCGCSELTTASVCLFGPGLLLIGKLWGYRKWNKSLILFTACSWVCTGVELLFSGSTSYANQLHTEAINSANLEISSLFSKILSVGRTVPESLSSHFYGRIEYIIFFSVLFLILGTTVQFHRFYTGATVSGMLLLFFISNLIMLINSFIGYVPPRVITVPLFWILIDIAAICFIAGSGIRSLMKYSPRRLAYLCSSILMCLLTVSFFTGCISMIQDIRSGWEYRDKVLKSISDRTQPVQTCTLPIMGSRGEDLSEDPEFEVNIVTAYYYDLPEVTAAGPCPPFDSRD